MTGLPFELRLEASDRELVSRLVAGGAERIGLAGLLSRRGTRAWPAFVRGAAAGKAFRWSRGDTNDDSWWPQGIDVAAVDGRSVLAVSWYARPVGGVQRGVRISFVDLRAPCRPRYHHVLLVNPAQDAHGDVRLEPVVIHAGGIGWLDDRLLVADTFGGLREFHLDDLLRVGDAPFGYAFVLPQHSLHRAHATEGDRGLRFSFVSVEHGEGDPRLVAGEYSQSAAGVRLVRVGFDGSGEMHEPGLYRMQGACVVDGTWYVTTTNGARTRSDLWVGTPGAMTRHRHVLPAGAEDLAFDRDTRRLWSLSEWPGARRVFTIDPERWRSRRRR